MELGSHFNSLGSLSCMVYDEAVSKVIFGEQVFQWHSADVLQPLQGLNLFRIELKDLELPGASLKQQ